MMITVAFLALGLQSAMNLTWITEPTAGAPNRHYIGNREPLVPNAFTKLPIGAITPGGWVRKQLELEADGFSGRLPEISKFLKKENNAWLAQDGIGDHSWEEVPYWLKGFGDIGYVLGDKRIIDEARIWIEGALASQRPSGYFGPELNLTAHEGRADIWPNMIMLDALRTYFEFSGDKRVPEMMTKYFHWVLTIPDEKMFPSYWEKHRGGDLMSTALWLYNMTGDGALLEVCHKIHRANAAWVEGIANFHGVNFAQAFREPATYYQISKNRRDLKATERNFLEIRQRFGQVPGGLWGADENSREGFADPRQAAETCTMAELMLSSERLLLQTGDSNWADRCDDVAFNSLPASMTADLKALRYLTSPNMVTSDRQNKAPGLQNGGPMTCMDPHAHRCCQHNVAHAWPYYAEQLWAATRDDGLFAAFYSTSSVTAKVGAEGKQVIIHEDTTYPFEEVVRFRIEVSGEVEFPLILRVPDWAVSPTISMNGSRTKLDGSGLLRINRVWKNGDRVELTLPMKVEVRDWPTQKGSRSVHLGPLTFSLRIGERVSRSGGTDAWPAFEIQPTTAWNYGLPDGDFEFQLTRRKFPANRQPFDLKGAPIELTTKARRIPEWVVDGQGLPGLLQQSPAYSKEPPEDIRLVPMGAARLRISQFPVASESAKAKKWKRPAPSKKSIPATASYSNIYEPLEALTDGTQPKSSDDESVARFTWWNHLGTREWVELQFAKRKTLSEVSLYWYDDRRGGGQCRVPEAWHVEYLDEKGVWRAVENGGPYGTDLDVFNSVAFKPVTSKNLRVVVKLQKNMTAGILEWSYQAK